MANEITEEMEVIDEVDDIEEVEDSLIITFNKPFVFEGTEYKEIDLTGLENIKGRDIISACRKYSKGGNISVAPQLELPFTIDIAVRASGLPKEFFDELPPTKLFKVHSTVIGFFGREE